MADKTFTEDEHLAILTDRVAKETADLTEAKTGLESTVTELQSKLDVAESAKTAAEQERDAARTELVDFKAEIEQREAAAARKDERLGQVKEVAAHLGEDFFTDEARISRIVAMDDGTFEGYLGDLKATAPTGTTVVTGAPRETAMQGAGSTAATGTTGKPSAARGVFLGRFGAAPTQEG